MSIEKILLFQIESSQEAQIRRLATNKKIRVISVEVSSLGSTLGELTDGVMKPAPAFVAVPKESLIVFCNVSEKHFDKMLFEMRSKKIAVDFKAILTETNRHWTLPQLYRELERERKRME